MSIKVSSELEEAIKSFTIVGETLDGIHTYYEYRFRNLITSILLFLATIFSIGQIIDTGSFWYLLAFGFLAGTIYYFIGFKVKLTYAITTFRIIRIIEANFFSKLLFQSSRLVGFTDLHYEHVESISIGTQPLSMPRFSFSLVSISIGWIILGIESLDVDQLISLIGLLFIVVGIINIIFSLPTGGVRLIVHSVSGDKMEFPEKRTPEKFIDDLIINCRTFLSYGAR